MSAKNVSGALFRLQLVLICLTPLPLGTNRQWSWSLYAACTAVLGMLWAGHALWRPRGISDSLNPAIIVLFVMTIGWVLFQISDDPGADWEHPAWRMAADTLGQSFPGAVTLSRDRSLTALMKLISYGLTFFLMFQFCRDPSRARTVLYWLVFSGTLYAVYGLIVYWGNFNTILWFEKWAYEGDVTATFVNRNSFATYAGLVVLCVLAVLFERVSAEPRDRPGWAGNVSGFEHLVIKGWIPMLAVMLTLTALISSHSRGGVLATGAAGLVFMVLVVLKNRMHGPILAAAAAGVALVVSLVYAVSGDAVLARFDVLSLATENRDELYALVSAAIADNPVAGFGYGTFPDGYWLYRDTSVQGYFQAAHDTYLETAFELGIPAATALSLSILGVALTAAFGVVRRRRNWLYPVTGVSATVLIGLHSLVDFSLQIPAVAATYSAIMAAAAAQSFPSQPPVSPKTAAHSDDA